MEKFNGQQVWLSWHSCSQKRESKGWGNSSRAHSADTRKWILYLNYDSMYQKLTYRQRFKMLPFQNETRRTLKWLSYSFCHLWYWLHSLHNLLAIMDGGLVFSTQASHCLPSYVLTEDQFCSCIRDQCTSLDPPSHRWLITWPTMVASVGLYTAS